MTTLPDVPFAEELPRFSLVIPCYNEEDAIVQTLDEIERVLADAGVHEVIVVNDGSKDRSGELLHEAANSGKYPNLTVVDHDFNRGYGAALKTGIRNASAPLVAITDADGTYPNERLGELVDMAVEHRWDMVVGARTIKDEVTYPLIRKIPKWFLVRWASWLSDRKIPDMNSGMRVFRREVALKFMPVLPDTFSFTTTISVAMLTNRFNVHYEPIGYAARVGKSKIKPIRDTLRFVQLITRTGMYFAPIRVLTPLILLLLLAFLASLGYDLFILRDLTDKTILLLMFAMNVTIFALLADMIDKRNAG
ncbi:MAG: glycosyltransferase family 2 protein [Planctomycetota bacterium]